MTWVKIDDRMPEHPKVAGLSDRAFRVHVEALCYCAGSLTDGFIPESIAKARRWIKASAELIGARLWEDVAGGWRIHDYLKHQRSKEAAETLSTVRAEAGSRGGKVKANAKQIASPLLKQIREEEIRSEPDPTDQETQRVKRIDDGFLAQIAVDYPDFTVEAIRDELAKCRNRKSWDTFKDHRMAFRNWMANARKFRERDGNRGSGTTGVRGSGPYGGAAGGGGVRAGVPSGGAPPRVPGFDATGIRRIGGTPAETRAS